MSYYRELNETEVGQLQVGDKVMVNNIKTEIVEIDEGFSGGTIGFFTEAPIYKRGYGEDSYFWGKHTSDHYKVYKLTGETTMKTKQFTKADLKTGHRVTTRNGEVWTVMKGVPSQTGVDNIEEQKEGIFVNGGWMDIYGLNDDLEYTNNLDYSVEKVELVECYYQYLAKNPNTVILWEREAPKSKEQIAYDEAVEATEAARQAYELAQKKLEALNPAKK